MNNNTISIWKNTWSPLGEFRRELDSVFGEWGYPRAQWASDDSYMRPVCDIQEVDDQYLLALEIPGVSKDDIRIEAVDNQLVVSFLGKFLGHTKEGKEGTNSTTEARESKVVS